MDDHNGLAEFTSFAQLSVDVPDLVEHAVDAVMGLLGAPMAAVVRVIGRRPPRLVVVHAGPGLDVRLGHPYALDPALAGALRGPGPLILTEGKGARFTTALLPGVPPPPAVLAAPVVVDRHPWGRLLAAHPEPRDFTPGDLELISRIAALTAAAIERSRRHRAGVLATELSLHPPSPPDSETEVALVDRIGVIMWVNEAWLEFARRNGGDPDRTGVGMSYLECCDAAADPVADDVADAIRLAVCGSLPVPMRLVIPCHSPTTRRWFDVLVSSRLDDSGECLGATVTLSLAAPAP